MAAQAREVPEELGDFDRVCTDLFEKLRHRLSQEHRSALVAYCKRQQEQDGTRPSSQCLEIDEKRSTGAAEEAGLLSTTEEEMQFLGQLEDDLASSAVEEVHFPIVPSAPSAPGFPRAAADSWIPPQSPDEPQTPLPLLPQQPASPTCKDDLANDSTEEAEEKKDRVCRSNTSSSASASLSSASQPEAAAKRADLAAGKVGSLGPEEATDTAERGKTFTLIAPWTTLTHEDMTGRLSSASLATTSPKRCSTMTFDDLSTVPRGRLEKTVENFIMQPSSRIYLCWELVGLVLVCHDMVIIPLHMMDSMDSMMHKTVNWVARMFWTMDMVVSLLTGYVSSQGVVEMRPAKIARQYVRNRLPLDAVIVGCDWSELVVGSSSGSAWNLLALLRAMRLFRLVRLVKNQKRIMEFLIRSEGLLLLASVQASLTILLCIFHVLACLWYAIQDATVSEDIMLSERPSLLNSSLTERYLFCFHAMLALFVGEHVVHPHSTQERIFTVVVLFFSFVVSAAFVGSLTTAMTRLQIIASQRSAQFAALSNYLSDYGISRELALRVQRNARHALKEQKRNTPESSVILMGVITDQLKAEIHYEVHFKELAAHPFFKLYNEANLICVRSICHSAVSLQSVSRGDVVFTEFEILATPVMFFITSGKLRYSQPMSIDQELGPRNPLAEGSLWTRWAHRGTSQATTECRLLQLNSKRFAETVTMYKSARHLVVKYATAFIAELNLKQDHELSDLSEDDIEVLVNRVFETQTSNQLSRTQGRRNSMDKMHMLMPGVRRTSVTSMTG